MADEPRIPPGPQYAKEDYDLAARLHELVPRKPFGDDEEIDMDAIPHAGRVAIQVWTVDGIIGNGGLNYLFEADFRDGTPYASLADAYDEIGANDCANAIRTALSLFPEGRPPSDPNERELQLDRLSGTLENPGELQELDSIFFDAIDRNVGLVADYIRAHSKDLAPYLLSEPT